MPDQLLSPVEVAELLAVSRFTVYRLIRDGELRGVKVRGQTRIAESALNEYLRKIGAQAPERGS